MWRPGRPGDRHLLLHHHLGGEERDEDEDLGVGTQGALRVLGKSGLRGLRGPRELRGHGLGPIGLVVHRHRCPGPLLLAFL